MATETVNVNATAITAAIAAEAAARVAGDAASVATAASDATTKANAAQSAAISAAATDATTKANAAQSAAIAAAAADATTKANAAQAAAIAASQPLAAFLTNIQSFGVPVFMAGAGVLTNQALALSVFPSSPGSAITKLDLSGFTQVKFVVAVTTASASANTPKVILRYFTAFSSTPSDFLDIGTSEVNGSLSALGVTDTGWINLSAGAIAANRYVRVLMSGGDGAADPQTGVVTAYFR
jgi:hypothetical protein